MSHMDLWNAVSTTQIKHTKKVQLGREFTAIDPHSQIMAATEQFGPAGQGWGWHVERVEYLPTNEVAVLVRLWHGDKGNWIEQWGQAGLYIDKADTRKDGDCMKKATTDALTKCLSYLGFNADVFLGKFDDNKYVAELKAKEAAPPKGIVKLKEGMRAFNDDLAACQDMDSLTALLAQKETIDLLNRCEKDLPGWWNTAEGSDSIGFYDRIENRKNELKQKEAA